MGESGTNLVILMEDHFDGHHPLAKTTNVHFHIKKEPYDIFIEIIGETSRGYEYWLQWRKGNGELVRGNRSVL